MPIQIHMDLHTVVVIAARTQAQVAAVQAGICARGRQPRAQARHGRAEPGPEHVCGGARLCGCEEELQRGCGLGGGERGA